MAEKKAFDEQKSPVMETIPLFPLPNVVLFPGMPLSLNIFEPRYRDMIRHVIDSQGTFGVQLCKTYNPASLQGSPFDVGTTVTLGDVKPQEDGRYHIAVTGHRRFKVETYDADEKPYLQGKVSWLEDEDLRAVSQKSSLYADTCLYFQEALRLARKLLKEDYSSVTMPKEPEKLSYFIAENLKGSLVLKQELLEMTSTRERLKREREILSEIVKTLAVQTQIEDAFR